MKNEQLRNFIKVVDCGSINKAAEQLYVSQPSLSRSIHSLEEEMGKELVIRSNRGVTLTPNREIAILLRALNFRTVSSFREIKEFK